MYISYTSLEKATTRVRDRRRQGRWSVKAAPELPPGVERKSGAAVRSTDLVWQNLGGLVAGSGQTAVVFDAVLGQGRRFYRVIPAQ